MAKHMVIFTVDKRQERLAALFDGKRTVVESWEASMSGEGVGEWIYVLPIPVSKLDANPQIKSSLKQELAVRSRSQSARLKVFAGVITIEWQQFFEDLGIEYWDFMKLPDVVEGNAWITAEAAVAEVLQESECSIREQKILVTGYGCCGAKIADMFVRLGAEVVVAARREEVREAVQRDGFRAIDFSQIPSEIADVSTVVNTVPAMVLTEKSIACMQKDSLIIDIASKPGGTDFDAAKAHGIKAKLALGLPGKYTTTSSARLLKNAIYKCAPLNESKVEDALWIFQVVI